LADSNAAIPFEEVHNPKTSDLPTEIYNSCITSHNKLTPNFRFIDILRKKGQSKKTTQSPVKYAQRNMSHALLRIDGHLFDSGLIHELFQLIEQGGNDHYNVVQLITRINTPTLSRASRIIIQIDVHSDRLTTVIEQLKILCDSIPKAQASLTQLPFGATTKHVKKTASATEQMQVDINPDMGTLKPTLRKIIDNADRRLNKYFTFTYVFVFS
jgi:hypothetical protein